MTTSVVAFFYESQAQARRTLRRLERLEKSEILDAAVMTGAVSGRLKIEEAGEFGGTKGTLGRIFPPSVLALRAVGHAADPALPHFAGQGFDRNLLKEIGENLPPGGAVLVAVVEERWMKELRQLVQGHAGLERYAMAPDAATKLIENSEEGEERPAG